MLEFVTYKELKAFGEKLDRRTLVEARQLQNKSIFLSHSSEDDELVPGVMKILENHGGSVYVDKKDPELDKSNFTAVAARLREAVKACRRVVLFVTPKSKASRWIPWELGLGDGEKTAEKVCLFPSAEYAHEKTWSEVEFLGLYRRIIWGNFTGQSSPEWIVYDHIKNSGEKLSTWIRGY